MFDSGGIIVLALLAAAPDAGVAPPLAPDIAPLVPPAPEYTLSLRENEWRVHVTFRPGEPQPGKLVELAFDIGRQRDNEAGEPQPWSEGKLALTVSGPGPRARYLVRASPSTRARRRPPARA